MIAVNSWTDRATARLYVDGLRDGPLAVLGERRTVQVRDGVLEDSFRGLGVHVQSRRRARLQSRFLTDPTHSFHPPLGGGVESQRFQP